MIGFVQFVDYIKLASYFNWDWEGGREGVFKPLIFIFVLFSYEASLIVLVKLKKRVY